MTLSQPPHAHHHRLLALIQTLPTQLILTVVGVILATALLAWFPEIWLIQEQLDRQAWSQVEQGRRVTQGLYQQHAADADNLALYISQMPEMRRLLDEGINRDLYLQLTLLSSQLNLEHFAVCNARSHLIVQISATTVDNGVCQIATSTGLHVLASNPPEAWWFAVSPIGNGLGQVIVGMPLNNIFATRLHAQTGMEHTILVDGVPVATSLARGDARVTGAFRQQLTDPTRLGPHGETRLTFTWAGIPYYASQTPLLAPNLVDEVALNVATLSQVKQRITRSQIISLLIMGLTGILIATILARRIRRSLSSLAHAATTFSAGNLDAPLHVQTGVREVSQVAQSLEQARHDLRHMITALRYEKAWGEQLLQAIVEGIATLDAQDKIIFWSKGAERITGWRSADVVARHCDEVFASSAPQACFSQLAATMGKHHTFTLAIADGNQAVLDVVSAPLAWRDLRGEASDLQGYRVVMFRDISEEVAVQRLLGHFMANMTHEFRTPLSALAAATELLMDQSSELSPEELQELLLSLHLGVLSLQTLVDNLLESSRLESGVFETYPRPADLAELVDEAAKMMNPLLAKYGQQLCIDLPPALPLVHADPRRTVQVLVNLIANSGKYGPADAEVAICAQARGTQIQVSVADRGHGVPVEQRAMIFSRFVHFTTSVSPRSASSAPCSGESHPMRQQPAISRAGTGLGLWIVKSIVEAQGGTVGVDARPGGGSIFWFTLQVAEEIDG